MECRIFDGQLGRHEFVMGVGSFLHGYMRRQVDRYDDASTLLSMNNLGSLHQKMGDYELALPLLEEARHSERMRQTRCA